LAAATGAGGDLRSPDQFVRLDTEHLQTVYRLDGLDGRDNRVQQGPCLPCERSKGQVVLGPCLVH
jgi:hypothetical protein